ncbi:hypothetical protein B0F90DRAFT_1814202 [Multifurca ochricompacta]|uniref:Protein kinase domain-containing protein n=1 Tax=Multifurca ochricompacta TaxID=376703 RepID=A0AAD4QRS5_9AGAM|nr:hypothetical protein B0F90DRAFT_1814202 [Multifurca ochricompacta]
MRQVQKNPDQRIANDRPNVDADLPPISLMYHGFGQFLDCIHTDSTNLEHVANKPKFEMAIDKFICEMSIFYESESARQSKTLDCLNDIFESYLGKQPYSLIIPSIITGQRSTDGHAIGPIGTIEVGVQIKNEFGTSSCDPSVEFAAYYTQSLHAKALQYLENNFLFPALGIVVVGAHIGFYALTFTTTTRLVSLTPLLPMAIENGNRNARQDLLKAFEAACILRIHINQDTQNYKDNPQECSLPGNFPYVNQVLAIPGPGMFNFQIDREAYQGEGGIRYLNRFIYMATATDSEDKHKVIVKFTRRYFRDLHEFCAQEGHAPKLLGYGNAPDGWHVVVMEWIDNEESDLQRYSSKYLGTWSADLRRLVNRFHEKGWVHGDLRNANLIISKTNPERIMLVDFDWGGDLNSGPVRYLTSLLNPELAREMDPNDLWITKERDKLVLEVALGKLEGKEEYFHNS